MGQRPRICQTVGAAGPRGGIPRSNQVRSYGDHGPRSQRSFRAVLSPRPAPATLRGVPPLLTYAFLSASVDVYAGHQEQSLDPIAVGAISFTIAALVFLVPDGARRRSATLRPLRTHPYEVIALNVSIAVTWLFLLYALKLLEPAVVNAVALAVGPTLTVLLGPVLRRGARVLTTEVIAGAGIMILIGVLSWGSLAGVSGVRHIGVGAAVMGLAATLLSGLGTTGNVIFSKRLSEAGYRPSEVLPIRYFLMIAICWVLVPFGMVNGSPRRSCPRRSSRSLASWARTTWSSAGWATPSRSPCRCSRIWRLSSPSSCNCWTADSRHRLSRWRECSASPRSLPRGWRRGAATRHGPGRRWRRLGSRVRPRNHDRSDPAPNTDQRRVHALRIWLSTVRRGVERPVFHRPGPGGGPGRCGAGRPPRTTDARTGRTQGIDLLGAAHHGR